MILILIAVLIFNQLSNAQGNKRLFSDERKAVYSETFVLKLDSTYKLYYLFKIPYNTLVFEKENSKFVAKFEIGVEIKNSNQEVIHRKFVNDTIELNEFDETISKKNYFYSFLEFQLPTDSFTIKAVYNDLLASRNFSVNQYKIDLTSRKLNKNSLLIENDYKNNNFHYIIDVFGGVIPHSSKNYDLLTLYKFEDDIYKIVVKDKDSILTECAFKIFEITYPEFNFQQNKIHLIIYQKKTASNSKTSKLEPESKLELEPYFNLLIIKNINEKLFEGNYKIEILDKSGKVLDEIPITVKWIDKPLSLEDYDIALEMIEFIEKDENFKTYFSSESEKKKKLLSYWKDKDPTPNTAFNELMNEFYSRVDFAQNEFFSISQKNGAKTDRGRVYILNGKPDKIERTVNSEGKVIESWYYSNPKRVFNFIDIRGDGSFKSIQ